MQTGKDRLLMQFSKFLAQRMGLGFPATRMPDLERGLEQTASDLGFQNIESLIFDLTAKPITPESVQALARRLTVGETYFFRDETVFKALDKNILPDLIRSRHAADQRLRLWSAGCCTGEEAYSLAISIRKQLPNWRDWDINILATDINTEFLKKAAAGIYGKWSFRTTPDTVKSSYFSADDEDAAVISADLQKMVSFKYLNLAGDGYPSLSNDIGNFDIIFCRNVLMYFTAAQAAAALRRLCECLAPGGWLVLGPSEHSIRPDDNLLETPFSGMHIYRKMNAEQRAAGLSQVNHQARKHTSTREFIPEIPSALPAAQNHADFKRYTSTGSSDEPSDEVQAQMQDLLRTAKGQGNRGNINEAIALCDSAIALDKMNAVGHYLRGILLQEIGESGEAVRALKRSIYLDPAFIVAHFALGNLERMRGSETAAAKHFDNARSIASIHAPEKELPESDGLTTGRLVQIIDAFAQQKAE